MKQMPLIIMERKSIIHSCKSIFKQKKQRETVISWLDKLWWQHLKIINVTILFTFIKTIVWGIGPWFLLNIFLITWILWMLKIIKVLHVLIFVCLLCKTVCLLTPRSSLCEKHGIICNNYYFVCSGSHSSITNWNFS